jgi:hypothetical protein
MLPMRIRQSHWKALAHAQSIAPRANGWRPPRSPRPRNMDKLLSYISEHRATLFEWEASRQVARQHRRHGRR